jgi:hypothetical protein
VMRCLAFNARMMKVSFLGFFILLLAHLVSAQAPCDDTFKKGLRKNEKFTAPCDSMVVFSQGAFEQVNLQLLKLRKEGDLHERGLQSLNRSLALRDSLALVYQKEIKDFEHYLQDTAGPISLLQTNLEKSIANTDRVIKIAHRNKVLGIVAGGLGGLLLGALVGAVAF